MRTLTFRLALALLGAAAVGGCSMSDRREVYRGSNGEALKAIVSAIDGAKRSVLARSPALPRPPVIEALAAARRRGVLVEFVVCADPAAALDGQSSPPEAVPLAYDRTHHPHSGAVYVIDSRTVVRTSYPISRDPEAAMIIRDTPELGERIAAECRSHIARATTADANHETVGPEQ